MGHLPAICFKSFRSVEKTAARKVCATCRVLQSTNWWSRSTRHQAQNRAVPDLLAPLDQQTRLVQGFELNASLELGAAHAIEREVLEHAETLALRRGLRPIEEPLHQVGFGFVEHLA